MNKKIIIVGTIIVLILILIMYLLFSRRSSDNYNTIPITPIPELSDIIPGIIVPTTDIQQGELDVVAVSPADQTAHIVQTTPIEITFSMPINEADIEFMIAPEISYEQTIIDNKLRITPLEDFQPRTLYTYRIEIFQDGQKIRMYTFSTAGDGPIYRPDTAPSEENIRAYEESVRIRYPDIYLQGKTPYETATFGITGTFSDTKNYYEFRVLLKEPDKNQARSDFILWLQTLDLTEEQIQSLDITYE